MRILALVLAAAACGSVNKAKPDAAVQIDAPPDAPDPLDGAKSGTRLKLRWFAYADGTKQFNGLQDAMLGTTCSPWSFFGDTKLYCIPDATSVYYADAGCFTKISLNYTPCNNPQYAYAVETQSTNCVSGVSHLYHVGALTSVANYYYKDSTGTCQTGGAI